MTITVKYRTEFRSQARTLHPGDLGFHETSGWTVDGKIMEDYFEWVNAFVATHPVYGCIKGDFETEVVADSQEAYDHFLRHHPFQEWDYWDI